MISSLGRHLGLGLFALVAGTLLNGLASPSAQAQTEQAQLKAGSGWVVTHTPHSFPVLVQRLEVAVKTNKMGLVNTASASDGAKAQSITIPGNRVVGVFRNDYARRMLAASLPAGIEAPIRIYLTQNADGTATLSYRTPTSVFTPYLAEAASDLKALAQELDAIFAKISADTVAC